MVGPDAIVTLGEEEPTMFIGLNAQNWDSGSSGPNQSWDYANLMSGESCDYIAMNPAATPYFDSFPNSDIYFLCTFMDGQGQKTEQHTYYQVEGNTLQLSGNVSISITNPSFDSIFIVYIDPLDWGTFPYSYEDLTDDTFEARVTSYIGGQTIVAIQEGSSTHEVDSYGSLTTPAGTFENTLRVKRIEFAVNSIPGIPFSSPQESYRYTWYGENENGVLLNLDSIVIKDFMGSVVSTTYNGSYRIAGPTMTSTNTLLQNEITIFPNPTHEYLNIKLQNISDYHVYIYNVNGKRIPYSFVSSTDNLWRIMMRDESIGSGIYYLNVVDKRGSIKISKPFILQN